MKGGKGQTLYYFLIFTLIVVLSWAMMLNIAKLIRDRMIMQNTADNAVLSIAAHKARTMNFVGASNYLIGLLLRLGTRGEFVQIPTYGTDMVASFAYGDWQEGKNSALSSGVARLKNMVDAVQKGQEIAMIAHLGYIAATYYRLQERGYYPIIYPIPIKNFDRGMLENPSSEIIAAAEKHFGLKRNMQGITYKKTENVTYGNIHYVYTRMFGLELYNTVMKILRKKGFANIVELFDKIIKTIEEELGIDFSDYTESPTYAKKEYSWYIVADNFKDQKTQIALIKTNERNKPLFHRWLGINYPTIYVFSAAAIYNTKGKMFPEKESELLGTMSSSGLEDYALHFLGPHMLQSGMLFKSIASQFPAPVGWIMGIIVQAYIETCNQSSLMMAISGKKDSPMNNYIDAQKGGWAAHLVPYKTGGE